MSPAATLAWDAEPMFAAANRLGPRALAGAGELRRLLTHALDLDDTARLAAVNRFFNRRIVFATDSDTWSQVDHWASPLELLGKGAGDCEDFAIAKYFSLHAAGVPSAQLRLVYARIQLGGPSGDVQPHMVLAYYPLAGTEPWILDNVNNDIRPASRRPDLTPVFSFNGDGLWQGLLGPPLVDSIAALSRWRKVIAKATVEGFLPDL
ncbi:MAG: transglutaminase-like cysteine peptidase [Burkholderiaceae bacterium]